MEFIQGYGLTETSPAVFIAPKGGSNHATIGYPISNTEAKVVALDDATLTGLDVGQEGELLVRGPQIMSGYLNDKEATDAAIVEGGWLRTGDLASYDSDGLFYIKDRLKELIKVNGYQVAPAELEAILRTHPSVDDAAVIAKPHETLGETPHAFVVTKPGSDAVTERELQEFVEDRVVDYKQLAGGVEFIDSVPKSATGKIMRRELQKIYGDTRN